MEGDKQEICAERVERRFCLTSHDVIHSDTISFHEIKPASFRLSKPMDGEITEVIAVRTMKRRMSRAVLGGWVGSGAATRWTQRCGTNFRSNSVAASI